MEEIVEDERLSVQVLDMSRNEYQGKLRQEMCCD